MTTLIVLALLLVVIVAMTALGGAALVIVAAKRSRQARSQPSLTSRRATPQVLARPRWRASVHDMLRDMWRQPPRPQVPAEITCDPAPDRLDEGVEDLKATSIMPRGVGQDADTPQESAYREDDDTEESDPRPVAVVAETVPPQPWPALFRKNSGQA